jgi:hypothetical protein
MRWKTSGDEKGQMAARTGYVLRFANRVPDIRAAERARITEETADMGGRARIIGTA